MKPREYYGLDAPVVVRNLGLIGGALVVAGLVAARHLPVAKFFLLVPGLSMAGTAGWMLVSSLWLKKAVMRGLIDKRLWRGDEAVLDVGCGRGLVAIEAARRAPQGSVHAIDLWQSADLSGNSPEALLANARIAGVDNRLSIDTGDARDMPYPDATFDVVASMTAIHNIPDESGRRSAIAEIWRVTKPGGQILIFDIRHARAYFQTLCELGSIDARLSGPIPLWGLVGHSFTARKPPSGRAKPAAGA